ncbi:MAG UNVERIFIED_CONTAM: hypothetical protein LVR18_07050 [Planctomycetaceae bacterium]
MASLEVVLVAVWAADHQLGEGSLPQLTETLAASAADAAGPRQRNPNAAGAGGNGQEKAERRRAWQSAKRR